MTLVPVPTVNAIQIGILSSAPTTRVFQATATVPTVQWSCTMLEPRRYATSPEDGVQDFDFIAAKPDHRAINASQIITSPIVQLSKGPAWVTGIRVHGETGFIEKQIEDFDTALIKTTQMEQPQDSEPAASDKTTPRNVTSHRLEDEILFEDSEEEITIKPIIGEQQYTRKILKISNIQERSLKEWVEFIEILGTRYPQESPAFFERCCTVTIDASFYWPGSLDLRYLLDDCAKQALTSGASTEMISGNLTLSNSVFEAYVKMCLTRKGIDIADALRIGLRRQKFAGAWHRVP